MPEAPQSYANHRRYDPIYHVFVFGVFVVNILVAIWYVFKLPQLLTAWHVVASVAMLVLFFKVRMYPLVVQDRLIRLEERLRLASLLPEPLRARIGELTAKQLAALRFASDSELTGLVEQALAAKLPPEEIKKRITAWRPDTLRV